MIDIYFVILNYNLYKETMECVASIKQHIDTQSYKIIIVDNASPNGAGDILKKYYDGDKAVEVLLLPENIGFARGNNVGISQARSEGAQFICCINDDAELISNNIFAVVCEKYQKYHPAVIGPKVINREGNVNEFYHPLRTIQEYEQMLLQLQTETYRQYKKRKSITLKYWLRRKVDRYQISRELFQKLKIKKTGIDPYAPVVPKHIDDTLDLITLGCCLFFTPVFFTSLDGFDDSTFLYYEEEFLYAKLRIHGLHSLYTPEISIWHKEGLSTSTVTGKEEVNKWRFRKERFAESLQKFIVFLKAHEEEIYLNEHET